MTLKEQVDLIDALPEAERNGLGNVCIGFDREVPKKILKSLQSRGLIVRKTDGRYEVVSHWVHFAWCRWCSRREETGPT
jgi:hypothetical protein